MDYMLYILIWLFIGICTCTWNSYNSNIWKENSDQPQADDAFGLIFSVGILVIWPVYFYMLYHMPKKDSKKEVSDKQE